MGGGLFRSRGNRADEESDDRRGNPSLDDLLLPGRNKQPQKRRISLSLDPLNTQLKYSKLNSLKSIVHGR